MSENEQNNWSTPESTVETAEPAKKSNKLPIIIGCVAAAVIILAVASYFVIAKVGGQIGTLTAYNEPDVVYARMSDDGTAYLPLYDGSIITINDEVKTARMSKDRQTIVVLLEDGTLYFTDKTQENKTTVADNASSFTSVRNDGFFYQDADDVNYRVTFSDGASVKLGEDVALTVAEDTLAVLYATDDGNIYTLAADSTEANKVGTFSDYIYVDAISNDGSISVWTLEDSSTDTQTIVLKEGDEKTTLGEINDDSNCTNVTFTSDQKLAVITNIYSDTMWIKQPGAEVVAVKMGDELYSSSVYTANGSLEDQITADVESLYVKVDADTGCNIYNVSLSGDRERVASKISSCYFADGFIVYTDSDNALYTAKINGTEIEEGNKIASDVQSTSVSENSKYIYYMKDFDDGEGSLYAYKIGDEEPQKVSSNVASYSSWNIGCFDNSSDGETVYYLEDAETIGSTYAKYGTLTKWSYSTGESEKISSDVISYSLDSGLVSGEINSTGFMFLKYSSVDSDDNIYCDWIYYDGTEKVKLASDVIR